MLKVKDLTGVKESVTEKTTGTGSKTCAAAKSGSTTSLSSTSGTQLSKIQQLYVKAQAENAKDTAGIHGLSDDEYIELQARMKEYGIEYENLSHDNFHNVAKAMARQIGKEWCYDTIAASYDSVLDLVLDEKLNRAIMELTGRENGQDINWKSLAKNYGARLQKEYGIVINISKGYDRNCWVSLVDENGNVIQDENGHLAQVKKSDAMLPDGLAQDVEKFASGAVDAMGYDCLSVLDFTPEEYEFIKQLAYSDMSNSELGTASSVKAKYGGVISKDFAASITIGNNDISGWLAMDKTGWNVQGLTSETDNASVDYTSSLMDDEPPSQDIERKERIQEEKVQHKEAQKKEAEENAKNKGKKAVCRSKFEALVKEKMEEYSLTESSAEREISKKYYVA